MNEESPETPPEPRLVITAGAVHESSEEATHRQLKRAQGLMERETGERFSFPEIARTAIKKETTALHLFKRTDERAVQRLARDCRSERERYAVQETGEPTK